ncbi:MAG: hypothetical protein RIR79_519 [Pseudomonadota bacterium]|jgi:hypothetical protein
MNDTNLVEKPFQLEFSSRVIEHLGIKLYQNKPTNVVAEFLSNSWDADATAVQIELKAHGADGTPSIVITDNGRGMTRSELTDEFLIIGRNRRSTPTEKTPAHRRPMGRKGIGKLAGFGIAQTIDIISSPHYKIRLNEENVAPTFYWLRFSLKDLVEKSNAALNGIYKPIVIADGVTLDELESLINSNANHTSYENFLVNARKGIGGVCISLSNTTLKKAFNIDALLTSLGRRFTVSMLRDDFIVKVNSKTIQPENALPPFHNFGFGDCKNLCIEKITIDGIERELRYWVKFVDIEGANWSIENAGVGIYTHGKIAQDRPFFFEIKGKEIHSRYIYGVIEADWLDELPSDVVSTDRRSIDWDTPETLIFHEWGSKKISCWIDDFRKWKSQQPKKVIIERIRKVSPQLNLTGSEEEALADLLNEVLPSLANDEEAKNRTTKSFKEAWTHAPTRLLTKNLWEKVFSSIDSNSGVFAELIENLRKSMVPEALGLAVTMAQRVAAITVMRKMIEEDKTETHLQRLIETFPWLLGPQWEKLIANQEIKTLVSKKHKPDESMGEWSMSDANIKLKPDFVFLSDAGAEKEFIVFELKGPEHGKTLQPEEYDQLGKYLQIIERIYTSKTITVKGVLVGHDKGGFREHDNRITVKTWNEVLLEARNLHVSYLKALLLASNPDENDARLQQILDFGGKETMELLKHFKPIAQFPDIISDNLNL